MLPRAPANPSLWLAGLGAALLSAAALLVLPAVTVASASPAKPDNRMETASGNGITMHVQESALLTWERKFSGTTPRRFAGRTIQIQRTAKPGSRRWVVAAQTKVVKGGAFAVSWKANRAGNLDFRAVLLRRGTTASAAAATPSLKITVYRLSKASWYGPGFFGHKTACGKTLRKTTLGVANRKLKCGTKVSLYYDGRSITVPVIDRGPYANGAYWDLTEATAQALGMTETCRIGTLFPV